MIKREYEEFSEEGCRVRYIKSWGWRSRAAGVMSISDVTRCVGT